MQNNDPTETINISLETGGEPVKLGMSVPSEPVKFRAMLPILRKMSNSFIEMGVSQINAAGGDISCRAGCGACCRQIVPISEAEAYDLRGLVDSMPEPRRSEIIDRFRSGLAKLNSDGYFDMLSAAAKGSDADYEVAIKEYFRFQIACPFLENESCSIHDSRPVTCREYLVTSPPELCNSAEGTGVKNVRHFFQVKEALISTARDKTPVELPFVPLIRILEWTEANPSDDKIKMGRDWMKVFFGELSRLSGPPEVI